MLQWLTSSKTSSVYASYSWNATCVQFFTTSGLLLFLFLFFLLFLLLLFLIS